MGESTVDYPHIVPTEVWLACWTLYSMRQLRRLSLVCQLFRSICLPLLLREQHADLAALPSGFDYSGQHLIDLARHMHRIAVRLDKLAEGPRVLSVRSWKFIARRHNHRPAWQSRGAVKFKLWDDIYACDIVAHDGGLVRLKSFTISGFWVGYRTTKDPDLQIASPERLHTLNLIHANADIEPLLTGLTRVGKST
ncbi:hypothetical protein C8R44DRAFT_889484 [Mycena epipterygia]|nr:hypothetical protein C8R44DRAFT_889484 [Mycena epipterygia]